MERDMPAGLPDASALTGLTATLSALGVPLGAVIGLSALAFALACWVPALARWRRTTLWAVARLLLIGEAVLAWFHFRLYDLATVVDPATGAITGRVAVPLWVESEKLFVWAVVLAVLLLVAKRHSEEILPLGSLLLLGLVAGALLLGRPFTTPLPDFIAQYSAYLQAMAIGGQTAAQAFQGMEGSRQFFYNTWYMWVHPPLLFLSYGAFAMSFCAAVVAAWERRSTFEQTAYRWARFGYLPLTAGMLLGFPWAILAWSGESWWWSGKVNMSIMMWLLYTAYLHLRLYLRRRGMWRWVLALAFVSFAALVLTYATTYIVPGAHSVAG
jgi:cytochrome c biogenesis factor